MSDQKHLMIKIALDAWTSHVKRIDKLLDSLSDEDLQKEVAPGRNRGIYLLGHLTGVHDKLLPLLDLGEQLHPELDNIFLIHADKTIKEIPSAKELRNYWKEINEKLAKDFNDLTLDEWFEKHTAVSMKILLKSHLETD